MGDFVHLSFSWSLIDDVKNIFCEEICIKMASELILNDENDDVEFEF